MRRMGAGPSAGGSAGGDRRGRDDDLDPRAFTRDAAHGEPRPDLVSPGAHPGQTEMAVGDPGRIEALAIVVDVQPDARRCPSDLQREALAEMRALIFELRPGNLEQDGLTRAWHPHRGAPGSDRAADRRRKRARRTVAARHRGGPLSDLAGGAPQRRQARAARGRFASRSDGQRRASGCTSTTTARASILPGSPTAISVWPGCAPGPTRSGRGSPCAASRAKARGSRSSSRPRRSPPAEPPGPTGPAPIRDA